MPQLRGERADSFTKFVERQQRIDRTADRIRRRNFREIAKSSEHGSTTKAIAHMETMDVNMKRCQTGRRFQKRSKARMNKGEGRITVTKRFSNSHITVCCKSRKY